jgi:hypothetical protein
LLLLQPLHVTEHLISMCDEIVVLFASDVLALVVVVVVALIFVKFNEPSQLWALSCPGLC